MNYLKSKMEVMNLLGCGYSVASLINKLGLTYNELCDLYAEYPDLARELNRWYPLYDFRCKKEEEKKTPTAEDISKALKAVDGGKPDALIVSVDTVEKIAETSGIELDKEKVKEEAKPLEEIVEGKAAPVKKKSARKKKVQ